MGGHGDGRSGHSGNGVCARAAAGTDAGANGNGECGSGGGGQGGEPRTESSGKKSNAKNDHRSGSDVCEASAPSACWTDLVDVDGDGVEEDTQFLLDKKRGILYTYKQDNYQCADGSSQNGDVLMGIYTQGNPAGNPSGSGWFVVAVKAGQCGEKKDGLFGCRFNASGKPTTCGTAKVKEESGEVDVVVKK